MYFILFINKIIKYAIIRLIAFKIEIYNFLIHEIRHLLIENKKLIIYIRINNTLKYKIIEKITRYKCLYKIYFYIYRISK